MKRVDHKEHRVTLHFSTDSGNEYLYDDASGMTFVWSDLRERVLSALLQGDLAKLRLENSPFTPEEVEREVRFLCEWREKYHAFTRPEEPYPAVPEPAELEAWIRKEVVMQLILVVTEDCNLRCSYCAYSNQYPLNRKRTSATMSLDLALRSVDYFFEFARPEIERNPKRLFGLTFYGGEPLLEIDLIDRVLNYAEERYPNLFIPVMTVNGTLLTRSVSEILARHNVRVSVSLDGPEPEHDRRRVYASGRGSFRTVMGNLQRLKRDMPHFFGQNLTAVSVYDYATDLEEASEFFLHSSGQVPPAVFVNAVNPGNTSYYEVFTEEQRKEHLAQVQRLRNDFKHRVAVGEEYSSYAQSLVGFPIASCLLRRRLANARPPFLPYGGACIPGMKLCVQADGRIDICERVNGTSPIGHMHNGGVDFRLVKQVIERFREAVCRDCATCPVTRLCGACFSTTEGEGTFEKGLADCAQTVAIVRRNLSDYYSIKELNPRVDFAYETDRAYLERRLMFL